MASQAPLQPTKYCYVCGRTIASTAAVCGHCRSPQPIPPEIAVSDKTLLPTVLLCGFLGVFGAHRFYVGKTGTAVLQLLTLGGLGLWAFADLIVLATGHFRDRQGALIEDWF